MSALGAVMMRVRMRGEGSSHTELFSYMGRIINGNIQRSGQPRAPGVEIGCESAQEMGANRTAFEFGRG